MFRPEGVPDLYTIFRDGLFRYLIDQPTHAADPWKMVPKKNSVGRQQTVAMVRKMINQIRREFSGGLKWDGGKLSITTNFYEFLRTHQEMGSSAEEARLAWETMRELLDSRG